MQPTATVYRNGKGQRKNGNGMLEPGMTDVVCGLAGVVTCRTFTSCVRQDSLGSGYEASLYTFYQRFTAL